MSISIKISVAILLVILTILASSWAISGLWLLFITPLGVPAISMAQAYGISCLVTLLEVDPYKQQQGMTFERYYTACVAVIILSLLAMGLGHIAAMFM